MKSYTSIITLSLALLILVGYNFISAQTWTEPTDTPPRDNTAAPINRGKDTATTQWGYGSLGFDKLVAFDSVNSDLYCDRNGENCFGATESLSGKSCPENYYIQGYSPDGELICAPEGSASCSLDETSYRWCPGDSALAENQYGCPSGYRPIGGSYVGQNNCTQGGKWQVQDCVKLVCGTTNSSDGGSFIYSYGYGGINGRSESCTQINAQTGSCSCSSGYDEVIVRMTYTEGNCRGSQQNCEIVPDEKTVSCIAN